MAINLEGSSAFLCNAPRRFAELIGTFLAVGGAERIYWSVGTMALHPRPFIEALWNFQMPVDLIEQYGMPPLTPGIKRNILGLNHARALHLDIEAMRKSFSSDSFAKQSTLAAPWGAQL